MNYLLRTYCEIANKNLASKEAWKFLDALQTFGDASIFIIQPYWKIESYFELTFEVETSLVTKELLVKLAINWEKQGLGYIWNFKNQHFYISNSVRWASLELIE